MAPGESSSIIAEQAYKVFSSKAPKYADTLFYKIVISGNVDTVKGAINYMDENQFTSTLEWLLKASNVTQNADLKTDNSYINVKQSSLKRTFVRLLMFIILSIISLITTPIFYIIHIITNQLLQKYSKGISKDIKLPMVFAAMSLDKAMMELFRAKGITISGVDEKGNNIFHYLADLSRQCPEKTIDIFDLVMEYINDVNYSKNMITKDKNSTGLSAIDYVAKFGSPIFLNHMSNFPELLYETMVHSTKTNFYYNDRSGIKDDKEVINGDDGDAEPQKIQLRHYDVTEYESGPLASVSLLLNSLSDRNIVQMNENELRLFEKGTFMLRWIEMKIKQILPGVLLFQVIDIIITILLLIVFNGTLWDILRPEQEWIFELEIGLKEIKARSENQSYAFRPERFHYVLNPLKSKIQLQFLEHSIQDPDFKESIFNYVSSEVPEVRSYFGNNVTNWNLSDHTLPSVIAGSLIEKYTIITNDLRGYFWMNLDHIMNSFAKELVQTKPNLFLVKIGRRNREAILWDIADTLNNFVFTVDNQNVTPALLMIDPSVISYWFCVNKTDFNISDVRESKDLNPPNSLYNTICDFVGLRELANHGCNLLTAPEVYNKKEEKARQERDIATPIYILSFTMIASFAYIVLDIIERLVFIYTCITGCHNAKEMLVSFFGNKIPGNYIRKQTSLLSHIGIPVFFLFAALLDYIKLKSNMSYEDLLEINNYIFIATIAMRIILHIHSTRLLPGIGHFVITTFMMGENLVHFSLVFGTILFIFSVLFHLLVENPDCTIEKIDGFQDIVASMFSTFKLTFSLSDFAPTDHDNPTMKLTYTIYVIIVGLLFMNLIIAVMSTTATTIMLDPWKEMTWVMEWLDEATAVEYSVVILQNMFCCCFCCCKKKTRKSLRLESAGYIVEQNDNDICNVYVETLESPFKF